MESVKKIRLGDKAIPIIIAIIAVVIVGIIAAVVHKKQDKVETQRTARVVEVNGPCSILREGATINAVADMPLYSGDTFFSGVNASARIMVDDDKFLYLDAATRINFTASGTPDDTHTMIYVETGSMFTEVKELLAEGESFDIVTPNTITEIHGTWQLTQVIQNWDGSVTTLTGLPEGSQLTRFLELRGTQVSGKIVPFSVKDALAFTTPSANLVAYDDLQSIAQTGQTANGDSVDNSSSEDMASQTGAANFTEEFLSHCQQASGNNNADYAKVNNLSSSSDVVQQENAAAVEGNNVIEGFKQGVINLPADISQVSDNQDESNSNLPEPVGDPELSLPTIEPEDEGDLSQQDLVNNAAQPSQAPAPQPQHIPGPGEDGYLGMSRDEQIQAVESAQAQVVANNQAAAQASQEEAERLAREQAAKEEAERNQNSGGGSNDSGSSDSEPSKDPEPTPAEDPTPTPAVEETTPATDADPTGDVHATDATSTESTPDSDDPPAVDDNYGGEFSGYYHPETGVPLYIDPGEHELYYLDPEEGRQFYYGATATEPPSTT